MALRLGTTLYGSKYSFRLVGKLGDKTVFSSVFKAEVLPGVQTLLPKSRWAVVKSADPENQTQVDCLLKEYKYYKKPSMERSSNFRNLCDIINNPTCWTAQNPFCLAFEWMDTTLGEVPLAEYMNDPVLVANIVKVCLQAFVELEKEHLVYSDLKPASILISMFGGLYKVKIGDLGLGTK
ncbi:hypothetical protein ONS95_014925 [Cadophora gregata]|uniref:uncharacterized protein n=1 Tax=Cadophora gregata TaxID=51156 RepID=UPI0026DC8C3E|nr:uncharacterized protein ONS95_014925 [Cadophora gregata]KAK0113230.1 hypothetical protein ONS95_014925 [Cadophora gregata]KAK0125273.1 hypothetical protein ONS96_009127 [Cadophora gregata f. sp. sojae]